MEEIFLMAALRELFKHLLSQIPSGQPKVLCLIILFIVLAFSFGLLNRPDCLSIQERKTEIAVDMHPICEAGYCEEGLFKKFATGIIDDASQCDQLGSHVDQAKLGTLSEQGQGDNYEDTLPSNGQVRNFT